MTPIEMPAGAIVLTPEGEVFTVNGTVDVPAGTLVTFKRWFVGSNGVLTDGQSALIVLSPYFYSYIEAQATCDELREHFPACAVMDTDSVVDVSVPEQLAEMMECVRLQTVARKGMH